MKKDIQRLHDSLKEYDSTYDESIREMSRLYKMPRICQLLNCPSHVRSTPYTFEVRRCGKVLCKLCPGKLNTPETSDGNLRSKVSQFTTLPIVDVNNEEKFMSYDDTRSLFDSGFTLKQAMLSLPKIECGGLEQVEVKKLKNKYAPYGRNAW